MKLSFASKLFPRSQASGISALPCERRRLVRAVAISVASMAAAGTYADESSPMAKNKEPIDGGESRQGPIEAEWIRDYEPPSFTPSWKKPQVNRSLAADFVVFAHFDLKMTEKLLDRYPELLNVAVDWGGGDFESAIGGASHMGRHDIVEMLLERGGRPDIFTLTMLGNLGAVKGLLELQPNLIDAKGPHGFSLHFHAQVGGKRSSEVLDYLQSVKKVELRPVPFMNQN